MVENFFGITDKGRIRDNNEDTFIAEKVLKNNFIAACVIDGVGGYEGGEIAASIAKDSILKYFSIPSGDTITMMREALVTANEKIYKDKVEKGRNNNMACVLTLALVDSKNNKFYYAHVGDTRLYLLRDNSLVKVTKDQSFVGFLEDSGRLSEEAAMSHPKRNEINKALGFDAQIPSPAEYIETGESPFLPGDLILLCSDGLTDMVNRNDIASILTSQKSLEEKGKKLIEAANNAGGKDNITVVLVQNDTKPVKQKATKPIAIVKKKDEQKKAEVTAEDRRLPQERVVVKRKNNAGIIILLSILCLIFLAGFIWLWMKQNKEEEENPVKNTIISTPRNTEEQKILDAIAGAAVDPLYLSDSAFASNINITDTIWIRNDSLYIKGNGNIFERDSSFASSGPAIMLGSSCKYIVLDSISFSGFDIAIMSANKDALHLRNVQFNNCRIQLAYNIPVGENINFTGSFSNTQKVIKDSLPKQ